MGGPGSPEAQPHAGIRETARSLLDPVFVGEPFPSRLRRSPACAPAPPPWFLDSRFPSASPATGRNCSGSAASEPIHRGDPSVNAVRGAAAPGPANGSGLVHPSERANWRKPQSHRRYGSGRENDPSLRRPHGFVGLRFPTKRLTELVIPGDGRGRRWELLNRWREIRGAAIPSQVSA
jgi:hypothetical protein